MIRIGMIGLDTSHVIEFTRLLNDPGNPHHVPGCRVTVAYPGGSPDFELSYSRVGRFTNELGSRFGVQMLDSPEEVARQCDAVMIESADGRIHLDQFRRVASYGKPVFIDKPLTVRSDEAEEIKRIADSLGVPVMNSSSMRFAEPLVRELGRPDRGTVIGADCYGPMPLQPTQKGFFWYGVHAAEMLYVALGAGCKKVTAVSSENHDLIVGEWEDGRIGTIRGNRLDNWDFGIALHREDGTAHIDVSAPAKPTYASLLEQVTAFFTARRSPVPFAHSVELIRFIEAANESCETGKSVILSR